MSEASLEYLEEYVRENRPLAPGIEVEQQNLLNRRPLDDALDNLDEDDRDVRRRVLGYSRWFDPANKIEVFKRLAVFGHKPELVENNAQRLHEAQLIQITEHHYLPLNEDICQQAAESLMDEFLQELEE